MLGAQFTKEILYETIKLRAQIYCSIVVVGLRRVLCTFFLPLVALAGVLSKFLFDVRFEVERNFQKCAEKFGGELPKRYTWEPS